MVKGKLEPIMYDQDTISTGAQYRGYFRMQRLGNQALNLFDRLQIDLLSGSFRCQEQNGGWTLPDDVCVGGATNLFIVLNNQTFKSVLFLSKYWCQTANQNLGLTASSWPPVRPSEWIETICYQ